MVTMMGGRGHKIMDVCKIPDTVIGMIGTGPMFGKLSSPHSPFLATHNDAVPNAVGNNRLKKTQTLFHF